MCSDKNGPMLDMALAKTYQPILVCFGKVSTLMVFQYAATFILFPTERYAIVGTFLYLDRLFHTEYIIDTNAVIGTVVLSLLVHELRDAGMQERSHDAYTHDAVLCALVVCNMIVLAFGEDFHENWSTSTLLRWRVEPQKNNRDRHGFRTGSLFWLVVTSAALSMLSTCTVPISHGDIHKVLLSNIRVWAFTLLCLSWFFSINHRELSYNTVAAFTPCVLRFSCVLFFPSILTALVGIMTITACLAVTNVRLVHKQNQPKDMADNNPYDAGNNLACANSCVVTGGANGFHTTLSLRTGIPRDANADKHKQVPGNRLETATMNKVPTAFAGNAVVLQRSQANVPCETAPGPGSANGDSFCVHIADEPRHFDEIFRRPHAAGAHDTAGHIELIMSPTTATDVEMGIPQAGLDYEFLFEQASLDNHIS
jgi:hypothetical protein